MARLKVLAEAERRGRNRRPPGEPRKRTLAEKLALHDVSPAAAARIAYRIANAHEARFSPVPQDVRDVVANIVLRITGDSALAHQILYGQHDHFLSELMQ
jgi:hypothetical protein